MQPLKHVRNVVPYHISLPGCPASKWLLTLVEVHPEAHHIARQNISVTEVPEAEFGFEDAAVQRIATVLLTPVLSVQFGLLAWSHEHQGFQKLLEFWRKSSNAF